MSKIKNLPYKTIDSKEYLIRLSMLAKSNKAFI